ncbi:vitamin K-dependent protein C [Carettochelys insculpta]|uniref:vitamin K-dependent protein C n=1 Tax=Carettochelys insculpta TaxID=44489 RepID=UPI003EB7F299
MWRVQTLWVLVAACSVHRGYVTSVFYSSKDANQILKIQKRANSFLEELKPGSLERECKEELCDLEEAHEIFKTREATLNFWTKYVDGDQCLSNPCFNGTCLDNIGRFNCICNEGWEGRLCQYEANYTDCSTFNGGCEHFCNEDPKQSQRRYCSCAPGYQLMDDHSKCEPVAEFPCGRVKANRMELKSGIQIRLIEGKLDRKGESPWQTMLLDGKGKFRCGGTLIHPSWVLTAAHCVETEERFKVRLGEYNRRQNEGTEQTILVDKCVSHENYSKQSSDNDIAILHLAQPVIVNKFVLPICLPNSNLAEQELTASGKQMVVTGWGSTSDTSLNYSTVLNYIDIPIVSRDACAQAMRHAVSENMLCAGHPGNKQDACVGDSGGPMVTKFKNTWFLVGLVSWGEGCGRQEKFGIYTKVNQYLEWIQQQIKTIDISSKGVYEPEGFCTAPRMARGSLLVPFLFLMCSIYSSWSVSFSVFVRKDEAHQVLKIQKRANQFLEEIHPGNLERECFEETCSFEEAKEIFQSQEKTMEFWFDYKDLNPCKLNPCRNGGVCKLKHYDYFCLCPPLFTGKVCEIERLECWYKNGGCWQYCQATAHSPGVVCSCAEGYVLGDDGKRCIRSARFPCGLIKSSTRALKEVATGLNEMAEKEAPELNGTVKRGAPELKSTAEEGTLNFLNGMAKGTPRLNAPAEEDTPKLNRTAGGTPRLNDSAVGCSPRLNESMVEGTPRLNRTVEGDAPTFHESVEEEISGLNGSAEDGAPRLSELVEGGAPKRNGSAEGATPEVSDLAEGQNVHSGLNQTETEGNLTAGDLHSWITVYQTAELGTRITGGSFCHRGHCPWQVFLRSSRGYGFCGGTLISSRWVVTAAHCLDIVRPHHVTVGDFDIHQREVKEQKIEVQQSWTHPHYDSDNYNSDIALLYLSSDVVFNEYALPICLPTPNLATLLTREGTRGMVSGWGSTHVKGPGTRFLMKVKLPIVSMETCRQATAKLITDNMFCAGYAAKAQDACKGDSGGPFAVSYHGTWYLLGVVSWGEGCAEEGKYGAYTRVANYIPWIKEVVENLAEAGGLLPAL